MTAPQTVTVGRLSLRAGALSEAEARRLAELVGLALGRVGLRAADTVTVELPASNAASVDELAEAVAHAVEAALRADGAR